MKPYQWMTIGLSTALLFAALTACSTGSGANETEESPSASPTETEAVSPEPEEESQEPALETGEGSDSEADALALSFTLLDADGAPLADASAQLTIDGNQADYPADTDGTLTVAGLPREGTVELVLTDSAGAELGTLELQLAEGSVTDVADSGDGTASLTVLSGAAEVALTVTVGDSGLLSCSLDVGGGETAA